MLKTNKVYTATKTNIVFDIADRVQKKKELQANKIEETLREIMYQIETKNKTTELVKSRYPSMWFGQDFYKWKIEMEG